MTEREQKFVKKVKEHYRRHGRRSLPWRLTSDPYEILVSEVMLQQTQVDRVIPKYQSFLKRFPTIRSLSRGTLGEVLKEWQGLGYNRRAKNLHACAKAIAKEYQGKTPKTYKELLGLPGVGPYTAGAVMAFAYNKPLPIIETNIRTAYIHHFWNDSTDVHDIDILRLIETTLDSESPRAWYWALMDYGAYVKKKYGNPNSRSKHYTKQSAFNGSDRQVRGAIIRLLSRGEATKQELYNTFTFKTERIDTQIEQLLEEGMIEWRRQSYNLPA